jgi:hypothetical protein
MRADRPVAYRSQVGIVAKRTWSVKSKEGPVREQGDEGHVTSTYNECMSSDSRT